MKDVKSRTVDNGAKTQNGKLHMNVSIQEVTRKRHLSKFVDFPYQLYRGNPYWVPPLRINERAAFHPSKNPAFEFCEVKQWLARLDGKIVGRVAGIIDHRYMETWKSRVAKFGWIDFIDDPEVATSLYSTVERWALDKGMEAIQGPMQFTDFDATGFLIGGYTEVSTFGAGYNLPYYITHTERNGYRKEVDYLEYQVRLDDRIPDKVERLAHIIARRNNLHVLRVQKAKQLLPYAHQIFDIINEAYGDLHGFVPLTPHQIDHYVKQYFDFIEPAYTPVVLDCNQRVVGFGITMPSLSKALQRNHGRLFPFGFISMLKARKNNRNVDLYLTAVRPEMQNKGVNAMLMYEINKVYIKNGIEIVETNRELESNSKVQAQWRFYHARQHKRRRVFRKNLGATV